jgi:transcriptional regulator with XRE-family HTH domain
MGPYKADTSDEFKSLDMVLALRQAAGLTQDQVAERMGTQAPAVARLERVHDIRDEQTT